MSSFKKNETKKKDAQPKDEQFDFIPEERLHEIVSILFPWGYSHQNPTQYTGESPYIGGRVNIITIIANDRAGRSPLSIFMRYRCDELGTGVLLGFYKGIMKLIAPELYNFNSSYDEQMDVISFNWAGDCEQENRFHAKVTKVG